MLRMNDGYKFRFNGATDLHRWKPWRRTGIVVRHFASMGPPTYIGGNAAELKAEWTPLLELQWGHRLTSVETITPRQTNTHQYISFNGATDLHRWKPCIMASSCCNLKLCFNGATDLHRWKPGNNRLISIRRGSFNGATDLHRWKH